MAESAMGRNNQVHSRSEPTLPRVGMLAIVRNRRAIIASVEPYDAREDGTLHLVGLEYTDSDGIGEDMVVWEREISARVLEPTALPDVQTEPPMPASDFDALQRATRWSALSPTITSAKGGAPVAIASPFFSAVQAEEYQLVPLARALRMPRVSLLLAEDVGIGKTIEAGLVLQELLLRRRIRRVLILSPASLRYQWHQEMLNKFALPFDVVDRNETHALQKRLGLDANPWRTYQRIITSYHYLKQPDVLEQFQAVCRQQHPGSAQLPWDLLIVDEAHNLSPANFGEDSDLSRMLRFISPWFEHKLFLTATPHNGHTRCFSGLLEQLDPVRFSQSAQLTDEMKRRIPEVVIRRLKRDINEADRKAGRTPRFAERLPPEPVPLYYGSGEKALAAAFKEFRAKVKSAVAQSKKTQQLAGNFAVEVLNKRLLSCPFTFADSWHRFQEGIAQEEPVEAGEVQAARRAVEEDLDDDREMEGRVRHAAHTAGAWLKPFVTMLADEIAAVDRALERLGLVPNGEDDLPMPNEDARWERLLGVIKKHLRDGDNWVSDERLVVFTEYKTTLDYLERRLRDEFGNTPALRLLYGGMDDREREEIKRAFNNPEDPVRILLATDAAAEGLNLQETARLVLHWDVPWNPARLDQRNGRLDRHGQARDVIIFHFTSEDDADLKFLGHVVAKVNTIREELGSMGEVFDAAFQRRFTDLVDADDVVRGLDADTERQRGRTRELAAACAEMGEDQAAAVARLKRDLDLTPESLKSTLETALGFGVGLPQFEGPDAQGRIRLRVPVPPRWSHLVDDTLRTQAASGQRGALPALVFDPQHFVHQRNGRPVFRPSKDTVLLHLGHPLFRQALALFARARFPGGRDGQAPSRWTVRYGPVPEGCDALLLLTVEELAVNQLREAFHHWVRTVRVPIRKGALGQPLPDLPAGEDTPSSRPADAKAIQRARELWAEVGLDARNLVPVLSKDLTRQGAAYVDGARKAALQSERERFRHRIAEVKQAMKETTQQSLAKERDKLIADMRQGFLFPEFARETEEQLAHLDLELERRQKHYAELLHRLEEEERRILEVVLPKRFALRGDVRVFPVTVEIRLPEGAR